MVLPNLRLWFVFVALASAFALTACDNEAEEKLKLAEEEKAQLQTELEQMSSKVNQQDSTITALFDTLDQVINAFDKEKSAKASLMNQMAAVNKARAAAERKNDQLLKDYNELLNKYEALQQKYDSLKVEYAKAQETIKNLEGQVALLLKKNDSLMALQKKQEAVMDRTYFVRSIEVVGKKGNGETYRKERIRKRADLLEFNIVLDQPEGAELDRKEPFTLRIIDPEGTNFFDISFEAGSSMPLVYDLNFNDKKLDKGKYTVKVLNKTGKTISESFFIVA